jgi:hypothetical protein
MKSLRLDAFGAHSSRSHPARRRRATGAVPLATEAKVQSPDAVERRADVRALPPVIRAARLIGLCLLCAISASARVPAQTIVFNYVPAGQEIPDVVGARYRFRVDANSSPTIKILFGWHRFYGPGTDTYLLETNLYSDAYRYVDQICTTWPLQGQYLPAQGSLRVAVPDYNLHGRTGAKTLDAIMFPRQTYEIDGIAGLWKTDMISQMNINGLDGAVAITRGQIVTDKTGWKCTGTLDDSTYREWDALVTIDQTSFGMKFALPDNEARYFFPWEIFSLGTEFFKDSGAIKVYLWDFEIQKENQTYWRPLTRWQVVRQDDPINVDGVRLATYNGKTAIEFSNEGPGPFFENGTVFESAAGLGFFTVTPCRVADTRDPAGPSGGPALSAGAARSFPVAGQCAIPSTAKSVSVNLTVTQPTAGGHLTLYPSGSSLPLASTMNYRAGQTRANNAVLPLGSTGYIDVVSGQPSGTVHFILDVNGYFE